MQICYTKGIISCSSWSFSFGHRRPFRHGIIIFNVWSDNTTGPRGWSALPSYFSRGWFSAIYEGLEIHSLVCKVHYSEFASCGSYGCEVSIVHCCFEPNSSVVGDGNWSCYQFGIVGCPGSLYFGSWDVLSTNIVECVCCMFSRDAIPTLCFDAKWAS